MQTGGMPVFTRRLLFGSLMTTDPTAAVIRRISAAIALGFLADGERLPREADLTRLLGVTAFTLREALAVLRDEGLIVTRAGRNGGSFVRTPPDSTSLALDELRRLSASELRDLGDWRQMLASVSAALAAGRASASNQARLLQYAHGVGAAPSTAAARRAHGRFHVELAAAAQSIRMSQAEFTMQEEFDWLFGLVLDDPLKRQESARGLLAVADAVVAQDPDAARTAAEKHSATTVDALARLRLAAIGTPAGGSRVRVSGRALAEDLNRWAAEILAPLGRLAGACRGPLLESTNDSELRTRVANAALAGLSELTFPVHGLGVLAEVDTVAGHPYWVDWWHRTDQGVQHDVTHVTDPSRDDFYDYGTREFMYRPRESHDAWASGPYVDYGGVEDYTMTFSYPILDEGRFLGVAATDLLVSDIERLLAPRLAAAAGGTMFLNAERRLIASNTVTHAVGEVVRTTDSYAVHEVGRFGWLVLQPEIRQPG